MGEMSLRLADGTGLILPDSLESITTYVVLEQEAWFEKESALLARWLRPGMTTVDIGANLGIYSLPMARLVAPGGQVFSYEPGSEPRALLERSRALNQANNLHVIAAALSDGRREGHLVLGASSEMNSLAGSGPGESVQVTCLDYEDSARGWAAVDFVKIDAEGEEERIFGGGRSFFERHSPLIMFEVKTEVGNNEILRTSFPARDYKIYRLLAGAPVLVPDEPGRPMDGFEINLFAAKPDRAAALAREGLLVEVLPSWTPDEMARRRALEALRAQSFARDFAAVFGNEIDSSYRDGLAGYATWRLPEVPMTERCAALEFACGELLGLCQRAATLARLSTLARAMWDAGHRVVCVHTLKLLCDLLRRGEGRVSEPFWPANPRFDALAPGDKWSEWFVVSALEQFERAASFSSRFGSTSGVDLDWLSRQSFVSSEIERRRVLQRARAGQPMEVPERLCLAATDHVNAESWRAGLVPNTWVREHPASDGGPGRSSANIKRD